MSLSLKTNKLFSLQNEFLQNDWLFSFFLKNPTQYVFLNIVCHAFLKKKRNKLLNIYFFLVCALVFFTNLILSFLFYATISLFFVECKCLLTILTSFKPSFIPIHPHQQQTSIAFLRPDIHALDMKFYILTMQHCQEQKRSASQPTQQRKLAMVDCEFFYKKSFFSFFFRVATIVGISKNLLFLPFNA